LIRAGLIAWQKPLYQVLALDRPKPEKQAPRSNMGNALSLNDILKMHREGRSWQVIFQSEGAANTTTY
jgi:hypothetical protein